MPYYVGPPSNAGGEPEVKVEPKDVPGWLQGGGEGGAHDAGVWEGDSLGGDEPAHAQAQAEASTWLLKRSASKRLPYWVNLADSTTVWDEPQNAVIIPVWIQKHSSRGRPYYVNVLTGETSWKRPAEFVPGMGY